LPAFELRLPETLPTLELPFALEVLSARLRDLRVEQHEAVLFEAARVDLSAALERGVLRLDALDLDAPLARLAARGEVDSLKHWASTLDLEGEWRAGLDAPLPVRLGLR